MFTSQEEKTSIDLSLLFRMQELIKQKFSIKTIVEYNSDEPNIFTFKFDDNSYLRGGEHENKRPLDFLKTYGGIVTRQNTQAYYSSQSVCALTFRQAVNAMEGLKQLKTPNAPDNNPDRIIAC
ncbi:MAG TPA: hypothetical protein VHM20_03545, partial [Gammaproteobacteria bacterium]|jgi:hypothetical protein|nr:hypothetical protein [Gammaproteobacteria bacterium]